MLGRFRAWYQDEGYTVDTIQAVLARRPTRPADFDARMKAVSHFRTLEEASALAAANKRVSNILAKATEPLNDIVHASVLKEAAEIELARHLVVLRDKLQPYFADGRYQEALIELAALRAPVDEFFENVMVNAEERYPYQPPDVVVETTRTVPAGCGYFVTAISVQLNKQKPAFGQVFYNINSISRFANNSVTHRRGYFY